jgi:Holliday junction resolvase RusA-like endonuclease
MSDFNPFHVRIDIKGKPIPKKRPRFTRTGIVYSDKAQLQQEKAVRILGKAAMKGNPPISDAVYIDIYFCFAMPKSWSLKKRTERLGTLHCNTPDLDNLIKIIDALNNVCFEDDQLIAQLTATKIWVEPDAQGTYIDIFNRKQWSTEALRDWSFKAMVLGWANTDALSNWDF